MMREIKFRAWSCHSMMFFDKPEDFKWFFGGSDGPERTLTSCELMQYTGLKDKNGKEIYEGDIIKSEMYQTIGEKYVIDDIMRFYYEAVDLLLHSDDLEIIGNIYENPELLK